jgi:nucleoid-associated protein YgaU
MPSQTVVIWAAATGALVVVAGGAAAYWAHPGFLWPKPVPAVLGEPTPETPATAAREPSPAPAAPVASPTALKPSFDVVTVEPTGETVVAGRAAPNARVELEDAGRKLAEATADGTGAFVIIPPPLPPGLHSLTLATGAGPSAQTSKAIAVAVAAPEPVPRPAPPAPAPSQAQSASIAPPVSGPSGRIAVQSIEAIAGGRLVVKGAADPNSVVRLYLSGAFVGDAKTGADGRWSLMIERGMTPGPYVVRADEINAADAKVTERAEAPFDYPAAAPQAAPAAVASAAPATSPADVVIGSIQTHHVESGHTLWGISQKFYGDGSRYQLIFAANASQIKNPNLIFPGQVFVVPKSEQKP